MVRALSVCLYVYLCVCEVYFVKGRGEIPVLVAGLEHQKRSIGDPVSCRLCGCMSTYVWRVGMLSGLSVAT